MRLAFSMLMQADEHASPMDRVRGLLALATAMDATGDALQAESIARQAIATAETYLGPNHPELAADRLTWAELLAATGDTAGCVEQSTRAKASIADGTDITVARATGQLALCLDLAGELDASRQQHEQAVQKFEAIAAEGGVGDLGVALVNYADTLRRSGVTEDARALYVRANDLAVAELGADDPSALAGLSHTLLTLGHAGASRRTASRARRAIDEDDPRPEDVLALLLLAEVAELRDDPALRSAIIRQATEYVAKMPGRVTVAAALADVRFSSP